MSLFILDLLKLQHTKQESSMTICVVQQVVGVGVGMSSSRSSYNIEVRHFTEMDKHTTYIPNQSFCFSIGIRVCLSLFLVVLPTCLVSTYEQ